MFNLLKNSFIIGEVSRNFSISTAIGLKSEIKRRKMVGQQENMTSQVKKVLEQKGQGLILMVRG